MEWDWGIFVGEVMAFFEKTRKQNWTKKEIVDHMRKMQVDFMKRTSVVSEITRANVSYGGYKG